MLDEYRRSPLEQGEKMSYSPLHVIIVIHNYGVCVSHPVLFGPNGTLTLQLDMSCIEYLNLPSRLYLPIGPVARRPGMRPVSRFTLLLNVEQEHRGMREGGGKGGG